MKNIRKLIAALLVLTLVLSLTGTAFAKAKFTKKQAASGLFVKFTGTVYGYNKPYASRKSNVIVKKGSVGLLVGVHGSKWAKVLLTDGDMNARGKSKELWFGVDRLEKVKDQDSAYIRVIFASGGSNMSLRVKDGTVTFKSLKGKKIQTTGKVDLRKYSSLEGKSRGVVKKGKKLTCTGKVGFDSRLVVFFQVKYNGKQYYVSAEYIKNWEDILSDAMAAEWSV